MGMGGILSSASRLSPGLRDGGIPQGSLTVFRCPPPLSWSMFSWRREGGVAALGVEWMNIALLEGPAHAHPHPPPPELHSTPHPPEHLIPSSPIPFPPATSLIDMEEPAGSQLGGGGLGLSPPLKAPYRPGHFRSIWEGPPACRSEGGGMGGGRGWRLEGGGGQWRLR